MKHKQMPQIIQKHLEICPNAQAKLDGEIIFTGYVYTRIILSTLYPLFESALLE